MKKQNKKAVKPTKQKNSKDGLFEIIAAFLVLFSAMVNPVVSVALAGLSLIAFGIYRLNKK
jgi:uncharacterized membrane protein HdeD (DUF308 family)